MAGVTLKVGSAGVAVSDAATGASIGAAQGATSMGIGIARFSTAVGLGVARACVLAPATVLGAVGAEKASEALLRADGALQGAHQKTQASLQTSSEQAVAAMSRGRDHIGSSMQGIRQKMNGLAESRGLYLRLVLGSDTTEVIYSLYDNVVVGYAEPLRQAPKMQLYYAAQAWAALQQAQRAQVGPAVGPAHVLPEHSERHMRYTAAAFGALRAGKLLDDPGAAARQRRDARNAVIAGLEQCGDQAVVSEASSIAELDHWPFCEYSDGDVNGELVEASKEDVSDAAATLGEVSEESGEDEQGELSDASKGDVPDGAAEVGEMIKDNGSDDDEGSSSKLSGRDARRARAAEVRAKNAAAKEEKKAEQAAAKARRLALTKEEIKAEQAAAKEAKRVEQAVAREKKQTEQAALKARRIAEKDAAREAKRERIQQLQLEKQKRKDLKQQRNVALKELQASYGTLAGRGAAALTCAGLSPQGIEVLLFEEANEPSAKGDVHIPGCLVCVDQPLGCVVVALRGSSCLRDALVDLDCKAEALQLGTLHGFAHGGMLAAAKVLDQRLRSVVEKGLEMLPEGSPRRLLLVGHSLGAGVASLLTALWHDAQQFQTELRCVAFACPQVLDASLKETQCGHTTSYVSGEDCVPCLSLATAYDLRNALLVLTDPESRGLDADLSAGEVLKRVAQSETGSLAADYERIRGTVGSAEHRLYPAGRLVKMELGQSPVEVNNSVVDEMVVTPDMVMSHMPRRYIAAVIDAAKTAEQSGLSAPDLWAPRCSLQLEGLD